MTTAHPAPPLAAGPSTITSFAPIVARVAPAVVNITSTSVAQGPTAGPFSVPGFSPDLRRRGEGSGVIVRADGYILTNNHVVDGARDVDVALLDGRHLRASVVGTDPKSDIAVVHVDAKGLPTVPLGQSAPLQVGDVVLAIGNPFGLGQTVTLGIVSARGRGLGLAEYEDFLQTDAAINPGNSGGALVDVAGKLVGINTALASNGVDGNQGIGFAVPIDLAGDIMRQLIDTGHVVRGWLGVAIQDLTPALADSLGIQARRGALVGDVSADSPAAAAGLRRGDVIVALGGREVVDGHALKLAVARVRPGTTVALSVLRDGAATQLRATLRALPSHPGEPDLVGDAGPGPRYGLEIAPLDPATARALSIPPSTSGVVVAAVQPASPAWDAGLRDGDLVEEVDRHPVAAPRELMSRLDPGRIHSLLVFHGGSTRYVALPALGAGK